jgi:acetolactate synthase-1/2/3 large subunit
MIELVEKVPERTEWINRAQETVQLWKDGVRDLASSDSEPIRPERLCRELTVALPKDAILVSDTGHSGIWTGTMIDLKYPDQTFIRCAGSLGWGLPAAIGAKCAQPDRPVLCFTGDGGIWYHLTELDTAARYKINMVIVVNNNHSLNQERAGVESVYGGRTPGSDELWMFPDTDFARVAESMGCFGITVTKPNELSGAVEKAFASGKPAVVDVKTDIEGVAPKPWTPA